MADNENITLAASDVARHGLALDAASCREHLELMFGDAPENLVAVAYTLPMKEPAFFYGTEVDRWVSWYGARTLRGQNCYAGVYLLRQGDRKGLKGGRGKLEDVAGVMGLWLDLDVKVGGFRDIEQAAEWLDATGSTLGVPPPDWVVMSGHGLQPFWKAPGGRLTPTAVRLADAAAVVERWHTRWAAEAPPGVRIDPCKDLTRVLRVAGTINSKEEPVMTSLILP